MAAAYQARGVAIAEAARRLGVDEDAIQGLIQTGGVAGVQVDGVWLLPLSDAPDQAAPVSAVAAPPVSGAADEAGARPDVTWLREQLAARDRTIAALTECIVEFASRASAPATTVVAAPAAMPALAPEASGASAPAASDEAAPEESDEPEPEESDGPEPPESIVALKTSLDTLVALTRSAPDRDDGVVGEGWRAGASRWTARSGSIWVFFTAVLSVVVYAALAVADVLKGAGIVFNGGHMEAATTLAGLLAIPATLWMNRPASARAASRDAAISAR
jgi:hypothetical protein